MSYWVERIDKLIEEQNKNDTSLNLEGITNISSTEFCKRNLAVEIHSEILKTNIWLCSNGSMAKQIKRDNPGSVCYTANELQELVELKLNNNDLRIIQDAKEVFPISNVIDTKSKEKLLDNVLSEIDSESAADISNWMNENNKEFSELIRRAEKKVNEQYKSGSYEDLKNALDYYKKLHMEAYEKMTQ